MADEIALNKAVAEGKRAELALLDASIVGAFTQLEHDLMKRWRGTEVKDVDARERIWLAINIASKVRDMLGTIVANGKLAQRQLDELAGIKKRGLRLV